MTNKILILFLLFTTTITYGKSYFFVRCIFNKYQEVYEIPQTGFYIEYEKIDDTEKISLLKT